MLDGLASKEEFIAKISDRGLVMYQKEKNDVRFQICFSKFTFSWRIKHEFIIVKQILNVLFKHILNKLVLVFLKLCYKLSQMLIQAYREKLVVKLKDVRIRTKEDYKTKPALVVYNAKKKNIIQ